MTGEPNSARRSIRMHLTVGLTLMLVLAGGFGGWASTARVGKWRTAVDAMSGS